jgi:hypothetical protein
VSPEKENPLPSPTTNENCFPQGRKGDVFNMCMGSDASSDEAKAEYASDSDTPVAKEPSDESVPPHRQPLEDDPPSEICQFWIAKTCRRPINCPGSHEGSGECVTSTTARRTERKRKTVARAAARASDPDGVPVDDTPGDIQGEKKSKRRVIKLRPK